PKPLEKARRALDVGEEECDRTARERPHVGAAGFAELAVEETERDDPVLLGGTEKPFAGALSRGVVLEVDLIEPREGVAHVRNVVDRQPAAALGIDVRERAVGKPRAGGGAKRWHGSGLLGEENHRALVSLCGEAPVHIQRDSPTLRAAP